MRHASQENWLSLAAAPTFATMAVLTGVLGGSPDLLCKAQAASPLGGMVPMYLLMSAFHLTPWLRLISRSTLNRTQKNPPGSDEFCLRRRS